jgi:hypothetical protein
MQNKLKTISILSVAFIFTCTSCDPVSNVDFIIENNTDSSIRILFEDPYRAGVDTSVIANYTRLIFYHEFDIGKSTKDYLDDLHAIPANLLDIENSQGKAYNKSELDISLWRKIVRDEFGTVTLSVTNEDFK